MFLNRLTLNEKTNFLILAHHVAHADSDFSEEEELIVAKYCMEMQMDDVEYTPNHFNLENCLSSFGSEASKKIVLLEIMAMVFADSKLAKQEDLILNKIVKYFGLNPNLAVVYKEWAKSILSLFVQGEALIHL